MEEIGYDFDNEVSWGEVRITVEIIYYLTLCLRFAHCKSKFIKTKMILGSKIYWEMHHTFSWKLSENILSQNNSKRTFFFCFFFCFAPFPASHLPLMHRYTALEVSFFLPPTLPSISCSRIKCKNGKDWTVDLTKEPHHHDIYIYIYIYIFVFWEMISFIHK